MNSRLKTVCVCRNVHTGLNTLFYAFFCLIFIAGLVCKIMGQDIQFQNLTPGCEISLSTLHDGVSLVDVGSEGFMDHGVGLGEGNHALFRSIPDNLRPGYRNLEDISESSGLSDTSLPRRNEVQAMVAADYDRQDNTDLYFAAESEDASRLDVLFEKDSTGRFANVTSGSETEFFGSFFGPGAAAWADYDLYGWVDLLVATTPSPNYRLLRNLGNGTFFSESDPVTASSWHGGDSDLAVSIDPPDGESIGFSIRMIRAHFARVLRLHSVAPGA